MANLKEIKTKLRKQIIEKRSIINKDTREKADLQIKENLEKTAQYQQANIILYYVDFRGEVSTKELIDTALKADKIVCVPITIPKTRSILAYQIKSKNDLIKGNYGIMEPNKEHCTAIDLSKIDLVITPGVAFDTNRNRLGYGGGYYDRLVAKLSSTCSRIALAYETQIVDKIPTGIFDVPVNFIITENRIIGRNKKDEEFKTRRN
ncbi:5-formyltetrahydrofolate cyclo-ligase [Clostridium sp. 'deep sea']|uniref:5-formyltetrahydrofolate cyclo-ligase n=1 Tax=Clostridium sp. 'deep sea' TaxID=2779445 RepID=UPI0018964705|nr:5-formyltetrahydrofolate cyclo-ligase [Clostridium sp. 'deep sea']QOR34690.1 5-formyltetrahydrofolate cyclo-ligase [Clostridium sp. 'deep sea']